MNRLLLTLAVLAAAGLVLRAGNGTTARNYAAAPSVSGELAAMGPDTMEPVMKRWIAAFRRLQPDAKVRFATTESESRDRTALGPDTAEVFAGSTELFAEKYHYEPLRVMVSLATFDTPKRVQALAIFVHPSNPLKGLTLGGGWNWQGRTAAEPANQIFFPAFSLMDAFAQYSWKRYQFSLNVSNVADKDYLKRSVNRNIYWAGPERLIKFRVAHSF